MEQIIFQMCVCVCAHTCEYEYRLTEQVNMVILESK